MARIVSDRTARPRLAGLADGPVDEFDREERAALQEFDGGLSGEPSERGASPDLERRAFENPRIH